jgi:hypothetical protein
VTPAALDVCRRVDPAAGEPTVDDPAVDEPTGAADRATVADWADVERPAELLPPAMPGTPVAYEVPGVAYTLPAGLGPVPDFADAALLGLPEPDAAWWEV